MVLDDLNDIQRDQVERQLKGAPQEDYITDIEITQDVVLPNYLVRKDCFPSNMMASMIMARVLHYNQHLYQNDRILDIFCGDGILGGAALLSGASEGVFTDLNPVSCARNLAKAGLSDRSKVVQGDLFEKVEGEFGLIIGNPPFFSTEPDCDRLLSRTMCMPEEKIEEFYVQSAEYGPRMLVCHWDLAGAGNSPESWAKKLDYDLKLIYKTRLGSGLQKREDLRQHPFKVYLVGMEK